MLRIRPAVANILVAPSVQPFDDIRTLLEDGRIDVVRPRQRELVEQIEVMPEADPVTVIAPRIVAMTLRRRRTSRVDAETRA